MAFCGAARHRVWARRVRVCRRRALDVFFGPQCATSKAPRFRPDAVDGRTFGGALDRVFCFRSSLERRDLLDFVLDRARFNRAFRAAFLSL